jgi:hypothetical protein
MNLQIKTENINKTTWLWTYKLKQKTSIKQPDYEPTNKQETSIEQPDYEPTNKQKTSIKQPDYEP